MVSKCKFKCKSKCNSSLHCHINQKRVKIQVERLCLLSFEISKALKNLNAIYMSKLFQKTKSLTHCPSKITVNKSNKTNVKQKLKTPWTK